MALVPLTGRTQTTIAFDPNFRNPYIQNWNASLQRDLGGGMTFSVRYLGNKGTDLAHGENENADNIFENGILSAFQTTVAGGNAPLFNQIFNGLNLGSGVIDGVNVTGSASLRAYATTKAFLASNSPGAFANWLNTTNSFTNVNGGLLSRAGLPQNFVVVNPQYGTARLVCSCVNSEYDALVLQFQKRTSHGWTFQANYTRSKALGTGADVDGADTNSRDPRNWSLDKQLQSFNPPGSLKASGTYELPFGPGRKFTSSSTVLNKLMEKWQFGAILTLQTGTPMSITATADTSFTSGATANTATVLGPPSSNLGSVTRTGNGVVYFPGLTQVKDPSIANLTSLQGLAASSTMLAVARNGQPILVNPLPGTLGNLGIDTVFGPGLFDLDVSLLKRITVKEKYLIEFRVDAIGSTNTPQFANPVTDINSTTFGVISSATGNRVMVANLRVTF